MKNNTGTDQQIIEKTTYQVKQIQTEDEKDLNESKGGVQVEPLEETVITNKEIQQKNIQIVRNMEKLSETEQKIINHYANNTFESSSQLQKDRRISALKKSQRKEISKAIGQSMKIKDESKIKNVQIEYKKRDTAEELIKGSFLEQRLSMQKDKTRVDVTGHERRSRASAYSKINPALSKTMDTDIDNLVQNMKLDMINENEYELDERLTDMRKVQISFKHLFERRDKVLGSQRTYYNAKKEDSSLTWKKWLDKVKGDKTIPEPTEEDKVLKEKQNKLADVVLLTKAVTFNAGATYEVYRSDLRAMERAKKQLEEDNEFQPSKYTQKMIERLNKKIEDQKIFIEGEYNKLVNPSNDEKSIEKVKKINAVCKKICVLADELKEMKKNLEGLQGEEKEKEEKRVKDRETQIEKEFGELIDKYDS